MSPTTTDPVAHFSASLRALHSKAALTQEELARRSGIHPSEIRGLEKGERHPRLTTATKLAIGLRVELTVLLEGIKTLETPAADPAFDLYAPENQL